jgi:hypothetical protein
MEGIKPDNDLREYCKIIVSDGLRNCQEIFGEVDPQ